VSDTDITISNALPHPPRTLVLVDDQQEFLDIARTRLTRGRELEIVGEATSGQAALDLLAQLTPAPEAVLLDVDMPGLDGFETARRLHTMLPALRIILTSASDRNRYGVFAVAIGAVFLAKRNLSAEAILRLLDAPLALEW
jgi:DNA-binding NarL/FixJ family response regulator